MRRPKGQGSIILVRGKYRIRFRASTGDQFDSRKFDTRAEAESAWASLAQHPKPAERATRPTAHTVASWSVHCLSTAYGQSLSPRTLALNDCISRVHIEPSTLGQTKLSDLTRSHVETWIANLQAYTTKKVNGETVVTSKPASPRSKLRNLGYLSRILGLAVTARLIVEDPSEGIPLPRVQPRLNTVLSPEQVAKLASCESRTATLMLLAATTGLRRSELIALEWRDVDFSKGQILVRGTKSNAATRTVPLMPMIAQRLRDLDRPGATVFATQSGASLSSRNVNRDVNRTKKALGLPESLRLHDLRGTFISLLVDEGTGIRAIMEMVGHASPKTTLEVYARAYSESKQSAVANLQNLIFPSSSTNKVTK